MICTIYVDHHAIFVYRRVRGYCYSLPVSVLSVGWLASMLHELLATRREVIFQILRESFQKLQEGLLHWPLDLVPLYYVLWGNKQPKMFETVWFQMSVSSEGRVHQQTLLFAGVVAVHHPIAQEESLNQFKESIKGEYRPENIFKLQYSMSGIQPQYSLALLFCEFCVQLCFSE